MKYKVGDKVRIIKTREEFRHRKEYEGQIVTIRSINPNGEKIYDETHYGIKEEIPFVFFESELEPVNNKKIVITSDGEKTLARLYEGNKVVKTATAKCSPDDTFDFEVGVRIAFDRLVESPLAKALRSLREAAAGIAKNIKPLKFEVGKQYQNGDLVIEITGVNVAVRRYEYKVIKGNDGPTKSFDENSFFGQMLKPYDPPKYYNGKVVCVKKGYKNSVPLFGFTVGKTYTVTDGKLTDNDIGWSSLNRYKTVDELCSGMGHEFIPLVE